MINDKDFKALEQRVSELEDAHNQLCHHADWKEFGVAGKPTPEATLPICPHCNKPINKRRLASDVCMCEWKGVPSQPEATPRVSGTKDPTKDHVMTGIVEDGEEYCDSCNSWHVCQPEATPDPRCSRCDLPKSLHPLEKCKVFQLEATPKFNPYDYSDEADTQSDGHPAPQPEDDDKTISQSALRLALAKEREKTVDFINTRIHDSKVYDLENRMSELENWKEYLHEANGVDMDGNPIKISLSGGKNTPEATPCKHTGQRIKSEVTSCGDCGAVISDGQPEAGRTLETPVGYCPRGYVDICPQFETCQGCEGYPRPSPHPGMVEVSRELVEQLIDHFQFIPVCKEGKIYNALRKALSQSKDRKEKNDK